MNETEIKKGHRHPIPTMVEEINNIFSKIGYIVASGPEAEFEEYNFDRLNFPQNHPSRDMQDTFWLPKEEGRKPMVMRTHTSPVQARFLENNQPPIKIIAPGKVFRNEATDATHEAQFFQLECLCVDKNINLGHLKGTIEYFFKEFFGAGVEMRFRPSFFPFVEPGIEVDMKVTSGNSRLVGRWIEVMGAGMVHPNVLESGGVDSKIYSGFAFGVGIDRLAVMKYQIDDIRNLYNGDLRLVNQF